MNRLLLIALLALPAPLLHAESAYTALRALATERGEDLLNRVVEVRGRNGVPQPEAWTITVDDPASRGGVRVYEVSQSRVLSERAPVSRSSGGNELMDFNQLNLDSSGAFSIAEQEAVQARVGFDRVDYILRAGERGRAPVWLIDMTDRDGRPVARARVAADDGQVLAIDRLRGASAEERERYTDYRVRDRDYVDDDSRDRYYVDEDGESFADRMRRFGNRVERHFRRDAATMEKFFTGRRTLDRDEQ